MGRAGLPGPLPRHVRLRPLGQGASGELFLFRDRIGIKPLYYTLTPGGTLVFGSEIKAILAHPAVEREIDPRALDLYLTLEYVPAPFSIFKGIRKLPAGHWLEFDDGPDRGPAILGRRAGGRSGERNVAPADIAEPDDELYALLKESVKLRLVSDVPLGAFLSGGIDSSTVVGPDARAGGLAAEDFLDRLRRPDLQRARATPAASPSGSRPSTRSSSSSRRPWS